MCEQKKKLGPRQLEVLRLLATDHSCKVTAMILHVSVKTIENHRTVIRKKLQVKGGVSQLTHYALHHKPSL